MVIIIPSTMKLIAPAQGARLRSFHHVHPSKALSGAEERFFRVLSPISGDRIHIVCKPRLADFIQQTEGLAASKAFCEKHVGFLVCRLEDWMPMMGIEVTDESHAHAGNRQRDPFMDKLFGHLKLPMLHVRMRDALQQQEVLIKRLTDAWEERCRDLGAGTNEMPAGQVLNAGDTVHDPRSAV
jgi:hypothetical protein